MAIRAYVNRVGQGRGPVIVELWQDGTRKARSFCQQVHLVGNVTLKSVKGVQAGFEGFGGPVHTWAESDADVVGGLVGVTHTEGGVHTEAGQ